MSAPSSIRFLALRLLFFGAILFALVMASLPHPPELPGQPSDKAQHIIAFVVLTALARAAYPTARALRILLSLCTLGVLIEIVQAIPALHRDASIWDWLADCMAVSAILGLLATAHKAN